MVVNFGHVAFAQIRQLVANLNKRNFKASSSELNQLIETYGHEAHVFFVHLMILNVDLKNPKAVQDQTRIQWLAQELAVVFSKCNFVSILVQALEGVPVAEDFCANLSKLLKLSFGQQVVFGLALAQSNDMVVNQQGLKFLKTKCIDLNISNASSVPEHGLRNLIHLLRSNASLVKERDSLSRTWSSMNLDECHDVSVRPMLHCDIKDVDHIGGLIEQNKLANLKDSYSQMAEVMEDFGFCCSANSEVLLDIIRTVDGANELSVSHTLAMMARTCDSESRNFQYAYVCLEDNSSKKWNIQTFVDVIKTQAPQLDWDQVIFLLDNANLGSIGKQGLKLIVDSYLCACEKDFPFAAFWGCWKFSNSQFAVLKALIECEEYHGSVIKASDRTACTESIWGSVDLVDTLIKLSDMRGRSDVSELFSVPSRDCPDVLILCLAQCCSSWGCLHQNLFTTLFFNVLRTSSREPDELLRKLWTCNSGTFVRGLIAFYYMDSQLSNVRKIVEVLQLVSPHALSEALSIRHDFRFLFDVALVADHSNAMSLESWISRSISEGGDIFSVNCTCILKERLQGRKTADESTSMLMSQASTILRALQASKNAIIQEDVVSLIRECQGRLVGGAPTVQNGASSVSVPGSQAPAPGNGVGPPSTVENQEALQQSSPAQPNQPLFPTDIEEEANSHFQRIYTAEMQIDGVIQMLKGFKLSQNPREQEVFACMIHNLFDEYRFFPRYPERELLITGKLFGSLIQHQLVSSITLGIALRYVLEALRKPLRSSMFKFGMCALEQFKSRLVEWPQYCHHILQIQHIRSSHEELIDYIQRALSGGRPVPETIQQVSSSSMAPQVLAAQSASYLGVAPEAMMAASTQMPGGTAMHSSAQAQAYGAFGLQQPPSSGSAYSGFSQGFGQDPHHQLPSNLQNFASDSSGGLAAMSLGAGQDQGPQQLDMRSAAVQQTLSVVSGASAFGATTNVEFLLQNAKQVVQPESALIDKVHFIFNNLSNTNLEQKEKDLVTALNESHVPWLCQYIVIKRAAQEANYHTLYIQFCDRLDKKTTFSQLLKGVLTCTIENIKTVLSDEAIRTSSSVRSLLKNLGSWLGLLTLSKNKPILQRDLDFKQLILDAYDKSRLIAVVPFVAKVIDSCANSRIFRPPNPWTMMVLGMLAELHPMNDLKLSIKFEVEVLCKNLNKDVKDIRPSAVFKSRPVVKDGSNDWTNPNQNSIPEPALKAQPTVPDPRLVEAADRLNARSGNMLSAGMQQGVMESAGMMEAQGSLPVQGSAMAESLQGGIPNIAQFIVINPNIPIFQQVPQLRGLVVSAISLAIKEIISPVVERSVTIARLTTQELILKDFAFEVDEGQIKSASHMMVQNLAGSLALVTCKEPLRHSMCNQLRTMLQKYTALNMEANTLEQVVQQIAFENLDLGCNMIEKAATDKAIRDIDLTLDAALVQRRKPGTPLYENLVMMQNWLRYLPEQLRPKSGGLLPHQKRVYEDFARLPRERMAAQMAGSVQQASGASDGGMRAYGEGAAGVPIAGVAQAQAAVVAIVEKCCVFLAKAEEFVQRSQLAASPLQSLPQGHDLFQLIVQARQMVVTSATLREDVAAGYAQKLFRRLYDSSKFGSCQLGIDWILASLQTMNEITKRVAKEITTYMAFAETERKSNRDLTIGLVQCHLLQLNSQDYLKEMLKVMDNGRNVQAVHTMLAVIQHCVIDKKVISPVDCSALLDLLQKLALSKGPSAKNEHILKVLEDVNLMSRTGGGVADPAEANKVTSSLRRDPPEPPMFKNSVWSKMQEWFDNSFLCQSSSPNTLFLHSRAFISSLMQLGWLKGDDTMDRFLRVAVEWSVEKFPLSGDGSYLPVDSLTRLVKMLYFSLEVWGPNIGLSRSQLISKVLGAVVRVLRGQYAERRCQVNPRPFHRLLVRLLQDEAHGCWALGMSEARARIGDDEVQPAVLAMADALLAIQPCIVPIFSFAWLELVSHKQVMPVLVKSKSKGWACFHRLLLALLKYLEPFLRSAEMTDSTKFLYKGTLRVLLVLLHDFPEFLCEYHVSLCDAMPTSCIQLRNLILSAFPRNMQLPDPLAPGLKVELLPEMAKAPAMSSSYLLHLSNNSSLQQDLDKYLKGRTGGAAFLSDLAGQLVASKPADLTTGGGRYNVSLLNALVLHTACFAISQGHGQPGKMALTASPSMEILLKLARDLDTEGRYMVLNSVANQLRYPNSHTHFFSNVLLHIFQSCADKEVVREQVTRVLIERLIVNKPHPWGLLITFIELIKKPQYDFWRHDFVRSSKEIEQLFLSVARFCGASAAPTAVPMHVAAPEAST